MKKIKNKWILVIVWMLMIFIFSNQPATISDGNSLGFIKFLQGLGINLNGTFGDLANFVVRKAAHLTEYCILALLLYNAIKEKKSVVKAMLITLILVFIYASTDEFHQLFIKGREGCLRDVLIDTGGGVIAIGICLCIRKVRKKSGD